MTRACALLLAVVAAGSAWPAQAQLSDAGPRAGVQLRPGVERAEVEALIATLRTAQPGVRDKAAYVPLLAGAPASYEVNIRGERHRAA